MNRVGEEQFSSHPLAFTSTFSISAGAWGTDLTSERCGLGWYFKLVPVPLATVSTPSPLVQMRLDLHLQPSTTGLAKPLFVQSIRSTATLDNETTVVTASKIDSQTITNTNTLLFPSSIVGVFSCAPLPFTFAQNSPKATYKLRIVVQLLSDGVTPCNFEQRTASALTDSIRSGDMVNTKFYLYSRHHGNGGASHPKPAFASSVILREFGSEDLNVFLSSEGFKSSEDVALDLYNVAPDDEDIETYEYDSDSDLEDDDDNDNDEHASGDEEVVGKKPDVSRADDLRNELVRLQAENNVQFLRTGRVIFIKDISSRTWNAFIKYVYFTQIEFSKLRSAYASSSEASARFSDELKCSPKSMYRLADKFGIHALKRAALANIKFQLTKDNILKEVFSRFTSKYPEVLTAEVDFLLKTCSSDVIQKGVSEALKKFGSPRDQHLQFALEKIMDGVIARGTTPKLFGIKSSWSVSPTPIPFR